MMPRVDNNKFTKPQTDKSITIPRIPHNANCLPSEILASSPLLMKKYFTIPQIKTTKANANIIGTIMSLIRPISPVDPLPTKVLNVIVTDRLKLLALSP